MISPRCIHFTSGVCDHDKHQLNETALADYQQTVKLNPDLEQSTLDRFDITLKWLKTAAEVSANDITYFMVRQKLTAIS